MQIKKSVAMGVPSLWILRVNAALIADKSFQTLDTTLDLVFVSFWLAYI